jgi:predicted RNA binding protein YcfA (HicA-like mRNA interferase family)
MARIEKLVEKFKTVPKDLTWQELVKILNHFGYHELSKRGKTGGSRRRFVNANNDIISLHKPHPGNIVKQYVIRQILAKDDIKILLE